MVLDGHRVALKFQIAQDSNFNCKALGKLGTISAQQLLILEVSKMEQLVTSLDITNICRICLDMKSILLLSIYDTKGSSEGSGSVADMLRDLTNITPKRFHGMPEKVCLACLNEINRCYSFKIKCGDSEKKLRLLLSIDEDLVDLKEQVIITTEANAPGTLSDQEIHPQKRKTDASLEILSGEVEHVQGESNEIHSVLLKEEQVSEVILLDENNFGEDDQHEVQDETNADNKTLPETFNQTQGNKKKKNADYNKDSTEYTIRTRGSTLRKKATHKCPVCPRVFVDQKTREKHMKQYRRKAAYNRQKQKLTQQKEHEAVEGTEKTNGVKEPEPVNENVQAKKPKYLCPRCKASFVWEKNLILHIQQNKCTQKQYSCPECGKVFISSKKLNAHIRAHKKELTCGICHQTFDTKGELSDHNVVKHNSKDRSWCTVCLKFFRTHWDRAEHVRRIHTSVKRLSCSVCSKSFKTLRELKSHMFRHNETRPFKCKECPSAFFTRGELHVHLRKHTGDRPFACNVCKKRFRNQSYLVIHKRIHTGERPYACEFCPMRFSAPSNLQVHRRTHTGERPFKCKFCERTFAKLSVCKVHMKTHL